MDPENEQIIIHVKTQDGEARDFRIRKRTPIQRLLKHHCEKIDADYRTVVFLIKGERFDQKLTPAQLKLKDGCTIEAFLHSHGGGPKRFSKVEEL